MYICTFCIYVNTSLATYIGCMHVTMCMMAGDQRTAMRVMTGMQLEHSKTFAALCFCRKALNKSCSLCVSGPLMRQGQAQLSGICLMKPECGQSEVMSSRCMSGRLCALRLHTHSRRLKMYTLLMLGANWRVKMKQSMRCWRRGMSMISRK